MSDNEKKGGAVLGFGALATVVVAMSLKPAEHNGGPGRDKPPAEKRESLLSAETGGGPAAQGPLKPVWDYLGQAPGTEDLRKRQYAVELSGPGAVVYDESQRKDPYAKLSEWPDCCALEGFSFRFLIATVPNPHGSGLKHAFDQVLEAVQRGLEADDYVIDSAWTPWEQGGPAHAARHTFADKHPGLVLFRDDRRLEERKGSGCEKKRLLVLLLVGETPTAGINKSAFREAVQLIRQCPGDKPEGNRIRVLGPHYSGSAVSLGMALREARSTLSEKDKRHEPCIKVVCGSASGFSHADFAGPEKNGWRGDGSCERERAFEATILPNDVLLEWVRKYLGDPRDPGARKSPRPIVLLHEANTSFGQYAIDYSRHTKGKTSADGAAAGHGGPELFLVPFPLHISQLRASYTKEQLARAESQGLPRSGRNLPFPTESQTQAETAGREAMAVQDPLMAAAIDDLVLDNAVTTMAYKQAHYSCLVSTDVRDTIFLARKIRDRHPDVQLVTLGGNLRLTHEDYNDALRGMIVASTYPLYPSVQGWSDLSQDRRYPKRILFADQGYEGSYNAALVHLAGQQNCEGARKLTSAMMDYGWEGDSCDCTLPPLWISVVGDNGQLVPVQCIRPADYVRGLSRGGESLKYMYRRTPEPGRSGPTYGRLRPPNLWVFSFVVLLVVNALFFYRAWRFLAESAWGNSAADRSARYKQRLDFAVGCLAQILLYGKIAELACTFQRAGQWKADWPAAVGALLGLAASLAAMGFSWLALLDAHRREYRGWDLGLRFDAYRDLIAQSANMTGWYPWQRRLPWLSRGGFYIVVADLFMLVLMTAATLWSLVRGLDTLLFGVDNKKVLDFERLIHLANGVSPLLPWILFCAALFIWSYFLVKKLYLANHYSIDCPFPDIRSADFQGLRKLHQDVSSELMPPSTLQKHFWLCLGMLCLLLACFGKLGYEVPAPVDGWAFGGLSRFGFFAGSFLLLFTLLQLYFSWHSLRKLLRFLALLPMQGAFERLPDKVVALFGNYLFSLRPRHSHLHISVQQLHQVRRLLRAFYARLAHAVQYNLQLGPLDGPALLAAYQEVSAVFPGGNVTRPVDTDFDRELDPLGEDDLAPPAHSPVPEWGGGTGANVHDLASRCLRILSRFWAVHTLDEAFGRSQHAVAAAEHPAATPAFLALPEGDPVREWLVAAEELVAMEIIRYVSQFIVQLRNLLVCLTVGSLLLLLAATVYPFFPQQQLLLFLTLLAGGSALFILSFLVQINRDELISRITRSTPNRFTPDLSFLHGTTAYILPIVAGVMVQFPLVTSTLRSLLDPLFHIIK